MSAMACAFHGPECSFGGTEADRCPWCHLPWLSIRSAGMHLCERLSTWDDDVRIRVHEARRLRRAAAQGEP